MNTGEPQNTILNPLNPVLTDPWKSKEPTSTSSCTSSNNNVSSNNNEGEGAFTAAFPPPWGLHFQQLFAKNNSKGQQLNRSLLRNKSSLREKNLRVLLRKFPDVRKYEARAALTLSKNHLDKAVTLIQVSSCYPRDRPLLRDPKSSSPYLRNVRIDLTFQGGDNHLVQNVTATENNTGDTVRVCSLLSGENLMQDNEESFDPNKVGVVISKTGGGYKANLL